MVWNEIQDEMHFAWWCGGDCVERSHVRCISISSYDIEAANLQEMRSTQACIKSSVKDNMHLQLGLFFLWKTTRSEEDLSSHQLMILYLRWDCNASPHERSSHLLLSPPCILVYHTPCNDIGKTKQGNWGISSELDWRCESARAISCASHHYH